jgi:hypothetical protein
MIQVGNGLDLSGNATLHLKPVTLYINVPNQVINTTHIVPIVSILKLVKVLSFCPQFPDVVVL